MYRVYRTETFDKLVKKLSRKEQDQITRIENQFKTNPFVGKPLGYRFFREKKIGGKIKGKLPEYYEAIKVVLQKR